jgi:hypothetical protein
MKRYDDLTDEQLEILERRAQNIARIRRERLARERRQMSVANGVMLRHAKALRELSKH